MPLADLEVDDVAEVLEMLAEAGVGGYAAHLGGHGSGKEASTCHRLWVDALQGNRAEELVMAFLRKHKSQLGDGVAVQLPHNANEEPDSRVSRWWQRAVPGAVLRVFRYLIVMVIGAGLYWRFFARGHPTPSAFLVAATMGVVATAVGELWVTGRYMLANHVEAKRRRRRKAQRRLPGP